MLRIIDYQLELTAGAWRRAASCAPRVAVLALRLELVLVLVVLVRRGSYVPLFRVVCFVVHCRLFTQITNRYEKNSAAV